MAKNLQNSAKLWITLDFDQEYIRIKISTSRKRRYQLQSLPRSAKKISELWSTNKKVLVAHFDPPKPNFLEDHILPLVGCCSLKYLHMLENDH